MLKAQRPVTTHALVRPVLRRISSAGRASALQAEGRRFDPVILHHFSERFSHPHELKHKIKYAGLAQLVEQLTCNQ